MREGRVEKKYLAVVEGKWPHKEISISSNLKKNQLRSGEREVVETPEGKLSTTEFKLLESNKEVSLLECSLLTGRTHQIRVQTSNEGFPVVGDNKYGNNKTKKFYRRKGINRMLLHAKEINFPELDIFCVSKKPDQFIEIFN
jgi:23S rRNA pseudouridine955/2504/2580 synthase